MVEARDPRLRTLETLISTETSVSPLPLACLKTKGRNCGRREETGRLRDEVAERGVGKDNLNRTRPFGNDLCHDFDFMPHARTYLSPRSSCLVLDIVGGWLKNGERTREHWLRWISSMHGSAFGRKEFLFVCLAQEIHGSDPCWFWRAFSLDSISSSLLWFSGIDAERRRCFAAPRDGCQNLAWGCPCRFPHVLD